MSDDKTPALFNPPSLEMFERYSSDLVVLEYEDLDKVGKPITKRWPLEIIGPNTKLIPKSHCLTIEKELEDVLVPAGFEVGKELARRVIGRYTRRELYDPDVFVAETTRVFAEAPSGVGFKAADMLRSCKFLPNVGDVTAAVMPLVEKYQRALHQVRAHLAEHDRRANKGAPPGEVSKMIEKFKSLAPAIKEAVGDHDFSLFWPKLWIVSDDGEELVLAQETFWLRDETAKHLEAISAAAGRKVKLIIRHKPLRGSGKAAGGPRPLGDVLKGKKGK